MPRIREYWPEKMRGYAALCDRLLAAYDEPGRGYHNRTHLFEVFTRIDEILADPRTQAVDRDGVLLAAWFHDAVYEAGGDNEERSALLAERELADAGVDQDLVSEVGRLVRLTATHRPDAGDHAAAVLCDADLGILAAGEDRYREYVAGVRQEYAAVPDEEFRAGRASVLRDLTAGAELFRTSYGREHWEAKARANIERELAGVR